MSGLVDRKSYTLNNLSPNFQSKNMHYRGNRLFSGKALLPQKLLQAFAYKSKRCHIPIEFNKRLAE